MKYLMGQTALLHRKHQTVYGPRRPCWLRSSKALTNNCCMEQLHIIKIGGNIIDNPGNLQTFLDLFTKVPGKKILVHGGGKLATKLAADLNIPQQMVDGR